ncbi:hypothetical protein M0R45_000106 [Rubus argutus]|uniref:EF-hand domain-containing protein n=1 Tax=Rubus argutus TaxID=59490 RepID=A0AAW1VQ44_RUBAR
MEDLRQTALAYYQDAPEDMRPAVEHFFQEMDRDAKDRVSRQDFLEYMKMDEDCAHMSNHSGRPFCNGHCKNFIKGSYFTCVKCYDNSSDTFNVCAACYLDGKYVHQHRNFLDNYLLPEAKRREALSLKLQREASSIINESKEPESVRSKKTEKKLESSSGSSTDSSSPKLPTPEPSSSRSNAPEASKSTTANAVVPVNPTPKKRNSAGKKAIKTAELALALGNIFVTSTTSQCAIL